MAFRRSIQSRRTRRRIQKDFELQLTSLMDVLVIILIFLLKTYSASTTNFASVNGIQLPMTGSRDLPPDSLQVIVTPEALTIDNQRIMDFVQNAAAAGSDEAVYQFNPTSLDEGGRRIVPLYDALMKARQRAELLQVKSKARDAQGNPLPFEGVLAIQADKRIRYDTLRKIMYTAAAAGYRTFRFLAMKKNG
ncbi:biopolymer transporter ExbD [bacterium]|nr:biopolymer transporter ExbD [bacterium]